MVATSRVKATSTQVLQQKALNISSAFDNSLNIRGGVGAASAAAAAAGWSGGGGSGVGGGSEDVKWRSAQAKTMAQEKATELRQVIMLDFMFDFFCSCVVSLYDHLRYLLLT
jgi:hypothetical protein